MKRVHTGDGITNYLQWYDLRMYLSLFVGVQCALDQCVSTTFKTFIHFMVFNFILTVIIEATGGGNAKIV